MRQRLEKVRAELAAGVIFDPVIEKRGDLFHAHFAEGGEVVASDMDEDPRKAVLGALYKTLAAWKSPHFIGRWCGILTPLTPDDSVNYELGDWDDCVLCEYETCQAYVHCGEVVKTEWANWGTKLQPAVVIKVGPNDWRWFCWGEIGSAVSLNAADIQVSLIATYGGENTRILDVWVEEKKVGELRLANGVYSYTTQSHPSLARSLFLPDLQVSDCLFPPFAERVPSKKRSDRAAMYEELGLSTDADDFSFLEASGGKLTTSTITLRKHV